MKNWRVRLRDIWAAITGRTFVSLQGYCFHCAGTITLECYQDAVFPIVRGCKCKSPPSWDSLKFNDTLYYPTVRSQLPLWQLEGFMYGAPVAAERQQEREQRL